MRFRFDPTVEQRVGLYARLARLQRPAAVLGALQAALPADVRHAGVLCTVQKVHSDRFVLRLRVELDHGETRTYALKVYSDDFGRRVWAHVLALAKQGPPNAAGLCLPTHYIPGERMLVFPWVEGVPLSKISADHQPELLRRAAGLAADLHRLALAPEPATTAQPR